MLFRKLVTNLPFSPALLNQVGFYAKRLRKEQATRRLGLLFTALAITVQSFAILQPPEPALAASPSNMVFEGVKSKEDLLKVWDKNSDSKGNKDIQQIFKHFLGAEFSRKDLENTKKGSFGSRDKHNNGRIVNLSRVERTTDKQRKAYTLRDANGKQETLWAQHLDAYDSGANTTGRGSIYEAFVGSYQGKWFAIMLDCGNLAFPDTITPPPITPVLTVQASCKEINGIAYDQTSPKKSLKVYIYMDGGPGVGKRFDVATDASQKFAFTVPATYHTGKTYNYSVVVMPAFSENESRQFNGKINTSTCKPPEPVLQCEGLSVKNVGGDRTRFALTGRGSAVNGATLTSYHYVITKKDGTVVYDKKFTSSDVTNTVEVVVDNAGEYTVKLSVIGSTGEKTSTNCQQALTVTEAPKCVYNPELPAGDASCKPCPGDKDLWIKDEECAPEVVTSKTAANLTQKIDNAQSTTAKPGDRIQYTLYIENTGKAATTMSFKENLTDVLEYADLTEKPTDGAYDSDAKIMTWNDMPVAAGQVIKKTIVVTVKASIPATPRSAGDLESYDCKMGNAFGGTEVTIKVACPEQKIVENTVEQLPATGAGSNAIFAAVLLIVVTYFYLRSRQLNKELTLLRKDFDYGTI